MGPGELAEIVTVARRHYVDGASKVEIAQERGLSRFKVGRLLQRALETGIVRIEVHSPTDLDLDLSQRLADRYGLRRALVVVTPDEWEVMDLIGRTAGELLCEVLTSDDVLGVGGGRSLRAMTGHLRDMARCDVVQLTGMVGVVGETSTDITRTVSEVNGGQVFPIFAPIIAPDARTATALRSQQSVRSAMSRYPDVSKAIVSIGGWTVEQSRVFAFLSRAEQEALTAAGVVGEVCTLPVDASGHVVPALDDRRIGIDDSELRAIDEVIGVAGGAGKTEAIRAVLHAGLLTSLVTDVHVARRLLVDDTAEETAAGTAGRRAGPAPRTPGDPPLATPPPTRLPATPRAGSATRGGAVDR